MTCCCPYGLSGHGLMFAGVTVFAMHRRKAGQCQDPQGPLQKPSCQPSATAAPGVGKTPQPAAGTPVQLQTLPREQHEWPAGAAAEGWPSSEHLPHRKPPRSHSARLLQQRWFAVLLSCNCLQAPFATAEHSNAPGCIEMQEARKEGKGDMWTDVEGDAVCSNSIHPFVCSF